MTKVIGIAAQPREITDHVSAEAGPAWHTRAVAAQAHGISEAGPSLW